jgi:hypothetical protein
VDRGCAASRAPNPREMLIAHPFTIEEHADAIGVLARG